MKSIVKFNCSVISHKITVQLLLLLLFLSAVAEAQQPSDSSSTDDGDAWQGTGGNVSPSMAIVVIVLVLGFFITGCIAIYIQQCVDTSSSATSATVAGRGIIGNVSRGLDQSVIDTFPTFEYSAVMEHKIGKGALECAVCLSEFEEDETLRLLPKCDHVFHSECIDTWLVGHTTCPVCRDNLVRVPDSESDKVIDDQLSGENNLPRRIEATLPTPRESNRGLEVRITIPEHEVTASLPEKKGIFPRSHSTGHSLIQPGENCERFTLRLPAEVRRQLIARMKLKRATSLVALPRQTSSRRGYRGGGGGGEGSGSSRYGRFFGRSFILRVGSFRSATAKVGVDGDVTAEKRCSAAAAVVTPLEQSFPAPLPV